jgi:hypothetical protein
MVILTSLLSMCLLTPTKHHQTRQSLACVSCAVCAVSCGVCRVVSCGGLPLTRRGAWPLCCLSARRGSSSRRPPGSGAASYTTITTEHQPCRRACRVRVRWCVCRVMPCACVCGVPNSGHANEGGAGGAVARCVLVGGLLDGPVVVPAPRLAGLPVLVRVARRPLHAARPAPVPPPRPVRRASPVSRRECVSRCIASCRVACDCVCGVCRVSCAVRVVSCRVRMVPVASVFGPPGQGHPLGLLCLGAAVPLLLRFNSNTFGQPAARHDTTRTSTARHTTRAG